MVGLGLVGARMGAFICFSAILFTFLYLLRTLRYRVFVLSLSLLDLCKNNRTHTHADLQSCKLRRVCVWVESAIKTL